MTNKDELQRIREIPITRILGLPSTNRRLHIKCPFHKEKSPSCVVYPDNSFYCYGCGKHGNNSIDFVTNLGVSFSEAVDELKKYL